MIGIKTYGGYVPFHRIKKTVIAEAFGKKAKGGEKAVAYYDEDSLTMAVAATLNAIRNADGNFLDSIVFATTTSPYREKSCASQIAAVLDCGHNIRTTDVGNTLKSASDAMLNAFDAANLGKSTLVAVADSRLGGADGSYENDLGDGAAAFVIGSGDDVLAKVIDTNSITVEAYDMWRSRDDKTVRFWDVRYANTQLYNPMVNEAVKGLFEKTGLTAADFAKVVCYAHEDRHSSAAMAKLGFEPAQIQASFYSEIGNTGTAAAPIMLAAALDDAKAGDKILYVSYGDGCNAIAFEVTEAIAGFKPARSVRTMIDKKNNDLTYGKYLKWKEFLLCEPQRRPAQERSSQPDYFRGYKKNHALYGSVCTECGVPHFPPQRVCALCGSIDKMKPYRFIGKKAHLSTFTLDGQSLSLDPPNNLVVANFEGGGKMITFMVDCRKEELEVGMPVELSFRRMFQADGVNTYFWKFVPSSETEEK